MRILGFHLIEKILWKLPLRDWVNVSLINSEFYNRFLGNQRFLLRALEKFDPNWFHNRYKKRRIQLATLYELQMTIYQRLERQWIIRAMERDYSDKLPRFWNLFKQRDSCISLKRQYLELSTGKKQNWT